MAKPRTAPATPAVDAPAAPFDFERSLAELEELVARLEQGDLPLEESLRSFERGVELTRACQAALARAEQKVETLLTRPDGSLEVVPFAGRDAADEPD
jgi:exodeoxyribonuclease VII small subunit